MKIESVNVSQCGHVAELGPTHAVIHPASFLHLYRAAEVEICFRFEEQIYILSGKAHCSPAVHGIRMEFSEVSRKTLEALCAQLGEAGLLDIVPGVIARRRLAAQAEGHRPVDRQKEPQRKSSPVPKSLCFGDWNRYGMRTSTRLIPVGQQQEWQCLMVDLSLEACRLLPCQPCTVVEGSRVEVQFVEHGLPLRLAGCIQEKSDEHLVRVRFFPPAPRMRERLEDLMAELSHWI
jgi:hypothetical protein